MKTIEPRTLKGFRDFLPREAKKRQYVIGKIRGVFESYGFEPLETPALEYAEILKGKYGEEEKLIYDFKTRGGDEVAMRYDQTVPLARVVAQYQNEIVFPFKRYQIQNVWRGENTQKGRYREFLQCDIDTIGTNSFLADAEIIEVAITSLKELGFKSIKMFINDRFVFKNLKPEYVSAIDKLEKIGKETVIKELIKKGMPENDAERLIGSFDDSRPTPNVITVSRFLKNLGLEEGKDFSFKASLARGLSYYTATIFELTCDDYKNGSLGGGGRYDDLIGMFAGKQIPAVGFSFGFDRVIEAMDELNLFPDNLQTIKTLVTVFSPELLEKSIKICEILKENGISQELYPEVATKLDKQLKYASQKEIPYVVIIGPNEAEKNEVTLRDMKTGKQETISQDKLVDLLI